MLPKLHTSPCQYQQDTEKAKKRVRIQVTTGRSGEKRRHSWDSTVGIINWLWSGRPRGQSSSPGRDESSQCQSDRFWGSPSLVSSEYWQFFLWMESSQDAKLVTHLQLVSRSRTRGYIHPLSHTPSWHNV
jgi:hypothetical protein